PQTDSGYKTTRLGSLINNILATLGSTITIAEQPTWTTILSATFSIPAAGTQGVVDLMMNLAATVTMITAGTCDVTWRIRRDDGTILRTSGASRSSQSG